MSTETASKTLTREEIAQHSWAILAQPVKAAEATAECANCGYGLVELPRPIRVQAAAEGIFAGDYLKPVFFDFAHWADDEQRVEDAKDADFTPCAEPEARLCQGPGGTGCEAPVQPGEEYCGDCLGHLYGSE